MEEAVLRDGVAVAVGDGEAEEVGGDVRRLREVAAVDAGELEAVEEGSGAAHVERVAGDGVDDGGDGDLDGVAVFEQAEVEGMGRLRGAEGVRDVRWAHGLHAGEASLAVIGGGDDFARVGRGHGAGAAAEVGMEVAEALPKKGGRLALEAGGVDVAAKTVGHVVPFIRFMPEGGLRRNG